MVRTAHSDTAEKRMTKLNEGMISAFFSTLLFFFSSLRSNREPLMAVSFDQMDESVEHLVGYTPEV